MMHLPDTEICERCRTILRVGDYVFTQHTPEVCADGTWEQLKLTREVMRMQGESWARHAQDALAAAVRYAVAKERSSVVRFLREYHAMGFEELDPAVLADDIESAAHEPQENPYETRP